MKKLMLTIIALVGIFASCTKECVTPISDVLTMQLAQDDDNTSKFAFNGRNRTFTITNGDSIFIGTQAYGLNLINETTATIINGPSSVNQNTVIFPSRYASISGQSVVIDVPDHQVFGAYGSWASSIYCPFRCYSYSWGKLTLKKLFITADFNVSMSKTYAANHGIVDAAYVDSIQIYGNTAINGTAYLSYGVARGFEGSNTNTYIPYDTLSAKIIPGEKEAILGYSTIIGGSNVKVYWHSGNICGTYTNTLVNCIQNRPQTWNCESYTLEFKL